MRGERYFKHVPFRGIVRVQTPNGRSFRIKSQGENIENGLYWEGLNAFEPESMGAWVQLSSTARTVLDVGANSGVYMLAAAASGAETRAK